LGNLTNLTDLRLNANQLSGTIPSTLGNLTNLGNLRLDANQLSGTIPSSLGNLTNLGELYLGGNQLSGTIPSTFGNLAGLYYLDLAGNQFSGTIPSSLSTLANLFILEIETNCLSYDPGSANLFLVDALEQNSVEVSYGGYSSACGLAPQLAPSISAQPTNIAVAVGSTAAFTVEAAGTPPLIFQWQFNGTNLADNARITGSLSNTLTISNVISGDACSYDVLITNAYGSITSTPATLSVLGVPVSFATGPGGIQYSNGLLYLQLTGLTGQGPVVVQASTNLAQWTPIFTNPAGLGTADFIDPSAGNYPFRFYRALTPSQ
jgi:hypothetical protein